jgi:hypothetical protein
MIERLECLAERCELLLLGVIDPEPRAKRFQRHVFASAAHRVAH